MLKMLLWPPRVIIGHPRRVQKKNNNFRRGIGFEQYFVDREGEWQALVHRALPSKTELCRSFVLVPRKRFQNNACGRCNFQESAEKLEKRVHVQCIK